MATDAVDKDSLIIGREQERKVLSLALDAARGGRGRVLLLGGDPGIGKTRLVQALAEEAVAAGMPVRVGRCHDGVGVPAYWPWLQIIRAQALETPPDRLAGELGIGAQDVAQWVPEIGTHLQGVVVVTPEADSEYARYRVFDSVIGYLQRAAAPLGLVLILEDLHWADRPSLLFLQYVARQLRGQRLLVLATHREQEMPEVVAALLREVEPAERRALRGMSTGEVRSLLRRLAGGALPQALVDDICEETEGNPFFVSEMLHH